MCIRDREDGLPSRIELMMCLPPEWNPESKESQENWPVELLRYLARFPIIESTWLGYGHSIQNGTPYADNTLLAGCVLLGVQDAPEGAAVCKLSDGSCNGVQREHNKKFNNGLPILHKVPPKRDYGRYFCIMAEKGGTSHGGLTEKLSPFFHAKKQEVNAYGR